jgi:O-antigen/teichoic acid export membrane protein
MTEYKGYNRFAQYAIGLITLSILFLIIVVNCVMSKSYIWTGVWLLAMFVSLAFAVRSTNKRQAFLEALNQIDWLEFKYKNGQNIPIGA